MSDLLNEVMQRDDLISPGISACVGCNVELTLRLVMKTLGPQSILAIPPGCMGGVGVVGYGATTGAKVPVFFPLLDNTAPMLSGARLQYEREGRDVNVVAFAGDGATVDAGFGSMSGAAERGDSIIYICYDNEGYMNTGFQRSGSTAKGSWTSTTPVGERLGGKTQHKMDFPMVMAMHDLPYMAAASVAYPQDLVRKVQKAQQVPEGFRYIHVLNPCPNGWGFSAEESIEVARLAVQTAFHPLFEVIDGDFTLDRPVSEPKKVHHYLSRCRKFSHLSEVETEDIQRVVDRRYRRLQALVSGTGSYEAASDG